jgi:hypothetical protein
MMQEGWFRSGAWDTFAVARQHEDARRADAKPEWDLPAPDAEKDDETPLGLELDGASER